MREAAKIVRVIVVRLANPGHVTVLSVAIYFSAEYREPNAESSTAHAPFVGTPLHWVVRWV
jgi:hypothetical protein